MNRNNRMDELDRSLHEMTVDDRAIDGMLHDAHHGIERAMKVLRRPPARVGMTDSPIGRLLVAESDRGLATIHFMHQSGVERTIDALRRRFELVENDAATERIAHTIARYFAGDYRVLEHPVDLTLVTSEFQRRTLARLRKVPIGSVITYRALAAAVGAPDAQRAVGHTMATNPVPIFVPCHRVIKSDLSIGNYGGGVENKVKLLKTEGFNLGRDLRIPEDAVLGHRMTHIFCKPECSAARRADRANMLIFADPEHARSAGLRACQLCHPS